MPKCTDRTTTFQCGSCSDLPKVQTKALSTPLNVSQWSFGHLTFGHYISPLAIYSLLLCCKKKRGLLTDELSNWQLLVLPKLKVRLTFQIDVAFKLFSSRTLYTRTMGYTASKGLGIGLRSQATLWSPI